MASFNLDIEKFYEELKDKEQQLKGIFCIQYPIYCIHANIIDATPEPLDILDKLIVDFIIQKSDFTPFQLGSLIGTSKTLIEKRIDILINDKLIKKEKNYFYLTDEGFEVFKSKTQVRQHKQSFDFFIDGLSFHPLPKIFYTYYNSKFISENDTYFYTNSQGETKQARPFGPDLVHTPPNKTEIIQHIFNVDQSQREAFNIPLNLHEIEDLSYTKLSLQLLVSVSSSDKGLTKEIVDGFAIYTLSENIGYYETVRKNIKTFEENVLEKIKNLEFKIIIPRMREDFDAPQKPLLTTNWAEIDKYKNSLNKCFSFSSEDLIKVIEQIFQVKHVVPESIINEDNTIEISINEKMLLDSPDRQKLINDLIRERDYKFGNTENNVFLIYLYYKTKDKFVEDVINFKRFLKRINFYDLNLELIEKIHPEYADNYRHLSIAAGEYEILEKLDIEKYMVDLK
jgi:hypothetical protein